LALSSAFRGHGARGVFFQSIVVGRAQHTRGGGFGRSHGRRGERHGGGVATGVRDADTHHTTQFRSRAHRQIRVRFET
jgi:hypothetical protein